MQPRHYRRRLIGSLGTPIEIAAIVSYCSEGLLEDRPQDHPVSKELLLQVADLFLIAVKCL